MGRVGEQSQGEVLCADAGRPQTVAARTGAVAALEQRDFTGSGRFERGVRMIHEFFSRTRFFFGGSANADLDDELRAHMEQSIDSKIAVGMSPAEARRQAAIEFGSMEAAREQTLFQHPRAWLDVLRQDLRFGMRSLRRDRAFTLVAVFILALGIGANISVFSLVDTILLRPLPFRDPDQVVWLQPAKTGGGLSGATYSSDAFDDLRDMNRSYSGVTGYFAFSAPNNLKLTGMGIPQTLHRHRGHTELPRCAWDYSATGAWLPVGGWPKGCRSCCGAFTCVLDGAFQWRSDHRESGDLHEQQACDGYRSAACSL